MTKFKNEYIFYFLIIVFIIYYFMGNLSGNGFSIGVPHITLGDIMGHENENKFDKDLHNIFGSDSNK